MRQSVEECMSCGEPMTKYDRLPQQMATMASQSANQNQANMLNCVPICRECTAHGYSVQYTRKQAEMQQQFRQTQ